MLLEEVSAPTQSKVLITFLENTNIQLSTFGIDQDEAAELRAKFASFEDWNDPSLDIYNDYDNARSVLDDRAYTLAS